jgi:hypothetical protein
MCRPPMPSDRLEIPNCRPTQMTCCSRPYGILSLPLCRRNEADCGLFRETTKAPTLGSRGQVMGGNVLHLPKNGAGTIEIIQFIYGLFA